MFARSIEPVSVRSSAEAMAAHSVLRTGDMWNSNSVTSWVLARAGVDLDGFHPPGGGRAPGWSAGVTDAGRAGAL